MSRTTRERSRRGAIMPQKRRRHSWSLAKIGASALSLLLVASMWPRIGFADDVQAGSGEPENAQQEAAPSEPSPLDKVAIPENSFGYDSQISLASQDGDEEGASTTGEGNASADGSAQAAGEGVASEAGMTPEEADPSSQRGIPKSARILSKQRQTHSLSPISRTTTSTTRRPTPA